MCLKKVLTVIIFILFYQTHLYSKSNSFNNFNPKNLSNYFSGIVAFENKKNSEALNFYNSSKILINQHDPYLKRYVTSLVLENKVSQAINIIRLNRGNENAKFFDAYLLLIIDSLKRGNFDDAYDQVNRVADFFSEEKLKLAILNILKEYIYVFKEKNYFENRASYGNLSKISDAFQKCYLDDKNTENYFLELVNKSDSDYSRYVFFYASYLIENERFSTINNVLSEYDYINSKLLISQSKNWVKDRKYEKFTNIFSCKNHNHVISEFLFLVSNLYSSQDDFEKSNFYLYLSNYLNSKFIYNLSLVAENYYFNEDFVKAKKILKRFDREDKIYYWFRIKKEAQIIAEEDNNKKRSVAFITSEFNKIKKHNNKMIFDIANFYKSSKDYENAIKYYSKVIEDLDDNNIIKADMLYRRGGSYERIGEYEKSDKDLLMSLNIEPNDAYVLNYLAYSWLERDYKIDEALDMLKIAYELESNDPYIIDSIGWAYYLIEDYSKAEKFLQRAVELMPEDPIVNDHYGDILWKLDQKIQARYFWKNVLKMKKAEKEMKDKINLKLIKGIKKS
jgi:tetratricopeptide (TPR) repeat protein